MVTREGAVSSAPDCAGRDGAHTAASKCMPGPPYYVMADQDTKGRVIGYGVYFTPEDQPSVNVQVDDGYFATASSGWKVALCAANALRDELNSDPSMRPASAKAEGR